MPPSLGLVGDTIECPHQQQTRNTAIRLKGWVHLCGSPARWPSLLSLWGHLGPDSVPQ